MRLSGWPLAWMRFSERNGYTFDRLGRLSSDALFFRQALLAPVGSWGVRFAPIGEWLLKVDCP